MRSWFPIPPICLDNKALIGEHRELHGMFTVISQNRKGYSKHPEVLRWASFLPGLIARHNAIALEMLNRGMRHNTPLPRALCPVEYPTTIEPADVMRDKLAGKIKARLRRS